MNDTVQDQPAETPRNQQLVERGKISARDLVVTPSGVYFGNGGEMMAWAHQMAAAGNAISEGFRANPGACLMVIDDAMRFRLSPTALIRCAYLVNGRIAYEAKVIAGLLRSSGAIAKRPTYTFAGDGEDMVCTATVIAADDGETIEYESPPIKQIDPKKSPLWKADPRQQLRYYTIRALGRAYFPEIMLGVYDPEEAAAFRREVIDVTPVRTSGLADRLPGPATTGFTEAHVDRELNGGHKLTPDDIAGMEVAAQELEAAGSPAEASEAGGGSETPAEAENELTGQPEAAEALSAEEAILLRDLSADLRKADTPIEVAAAWSTYAGSFEGVSKRAKDHADAMVAAATTRTQKGKPRGKK